MLESPAPAPASHVPNPSAPPALAPPPRVAVPNALLAALFATAKDPDADAACCAFDGLPDARQ